MAPKALNDLDGPSGLPPTLLVFFGVLVFGSLPRSRLEGLAVALPNRNARFAALSVRQ